MADNTTSTTEMKTTKMTPISLTLGHLRPLETDLKYICIFLRKYYLCSNELNAQAPKISNVSTSTEPMRPVEQTTFVNIIFLDSSIELGFISDPNSYEDFTDQQEHEFFDFRSKESKEFITLEKPDVMV